MSASTWNEFLEIFGDFAEQIVGHPGSHAKQAGDDARQESARSDKAMVIPPEISGS
jgi:hypothetical protein